jgi:hypothetical protein
MAPRYPGPSKYSYGLRTRVVASGSCRVAQYRRSRYRPRCPTVLHFRSNPCQARRPASGESSRRQNDSNALAMLDLQASALGKDPRSVRSDPGDYGFGPEHARGRGGRYPLLSAFAEPPGRICAETRGLSPVRSAVPMPDDGPGLPGNADRAAWVRVSMKPSRPLPIVAAAHPGYDSVTGLSGAPAQPGKTR